MPHSKRREFLANWSIVAMCALSFCSSAQSAPRDEIEEAKKIAIDEVVKRDGWKKMRADVDQGWRDKGGTVTVWRLPETPGGFRVLTVRKGKVIEYMRGH